MSDGGKKMWIKQDKDWTQKRTELLTSLYQDPTMSGADIAKRLNKTINAVQLKASRLRLKHAIYTEWNKEFGLKDVE